MERLALRQQDQGFNPNPSSDYIDKSYILGSQFTTAKTTPLKNTPSSPYLEPSSPSPLIKKHHHIGHRNDDSEISIFDAEKYFNGIHDPKGSNNEVIINANTTSNPKQSDAVSSISRISSGSSSIVDNGYGMTTYRARSSHATPTTCSEASWNSQTGLLTNPPGSISVSLKNIPNSTDHTGKKYAGAVTRWFLRRNGCPCSGRKSVKVQESSNSNKIEHNRTPKVSQLSRSKSGGASSSIYSSSSRQTSPKSLPKYPPLTPATPSTIATLIPNEPIRNVNFISRSTFDQPKPVVTAAAAAAAATNPILTGFQLQKPFPPPDRLAVTVRSYTDGNGTNSNGFTFPVLNTLAAGAGAVGPSPRKEIFNVIPPPPLTAAAVAAAAVVVDPPRDSLEIFQPRENDHHHQHRGGGGGFGFPPSPKSRRASYDDEMCSEASSDLFEIESFSTQTTTTPYTPPPPQQPPTRRDSLDDAASLHVRRYQIATGSGNGGAGAGFRRSIDEETTAATEIYAPSEVSVDWSVTTAEGFDRASLTNFSVSASEVGYAAMRREAAAEGKGGGEGGEGRSGKGGSNGGGVGLSLMGCRCEKAVSVGPTPVKFGGESGPTSGPRGHVGGRAHQVHEKAHMSKSQAHIVDRSENIRGGKGAHGHGHGWSRKV